MTGLASKKVLVTGGGGLIGSRLVQALLAERRKVRVLDVRYGDLDATKTNPNLQFAAISDDPLHGGMADRKLVAQAIKGVDVVYHLAVNWDGFSWRHEVPLADLFDSNIRGTLNLLEAATAEGVRHFLFASSAAVYGETQRTVSLRGRSQLKRKADEESHCKPYLWDGDPGPAYAILKLALENLCLMYYHAHQMPVTAFRVEYVFTGKEERKDGANIHADDVVRAFLLATLNKKAYGQIFNLAHPVPYISIKKIQRTLGWTAETTVRFPRPLSPKSAKITRPESL